jgi:hypothetical protein
MPKNTIQLPEGHTWVEVPSPFAQMTYFQCDKCNAQFSHDMESGEVGFGEGDGTCDEE